MGATAEGMLTLLLRKQRFYECMDELMLTIDGGSTQISKVIGTGPGYSDAAVMRFVDDAIDAYNHYPLIEHAHECELSYEDYLESIGGAVEEKGVPALLDADQRQLVKSMLYCLMRIIADSPFYKYRGTFEELKHECSVLLKSFAQGVSKWEFWRKDVERYVLSEGRPRTYAALVMSPGSLLYREMPILGEDGIIGWSEDCPTFFLDDLDAIYEAMSGRHLVESIPAKQKRGILSDAGHYAYLKDARLTSLTENEAEAAFRQGWLDEDDLRRRAEFEESISALEAERKREFPPEADEDAQAAVKRGVEKWLERFPCKDAWCKRYLAMRKAYFKLEGIDPLAPDFDEKRWQDPHPINARYLEGAIDAVLDQRGISHFTDDACLEACGALRRAAARTRRVAARG